MWLKCSKMVIICVFQTMEKAMQVLKGTLSESVAKEKRSEDELKSLLKSEISLRCQVDEYVEHATELEAKVRHLFFLILSS